MVEDLWLSESPGQAGPSLMLGEYYLIGSNPEQDLLLTLTHRFTDDTADAKILERHGRHEVVLEVGANGHHNGVK
jgi:hypothetical protein